MKKIAGTILLICASAGLAFGQTPMAPPTASAKAPSASDAIKQVELDWFDAMKSADTDKLSGILGEDWVGIDFDGTRDTKKDMLADIKTGAFQLTSYEAGPMEVKVLGNVAVVQGSDTEKSTFKGKDTTGKYVWMDVFAKRDGKWVAVRSQLAKVK